MLDKIPGPMSGRLLSSNRLGFGDLIGRGQLLSAPALDKSRSPMLFGEGQKGTPGRGRDRKCHDRASLSRPLVLTSGPLTSLTSFPLLCASEDMNGRGLGGASDKMGLEGKGTDLS